MSRRQFLGDSVALGATALAGLARPRLAPAQTPRIESARRIVIAGHAQPMTSFSHGLNVIGDQLTATSDERIDVKYVYNIVDLGYSGEDLTWLVESQILTLAYATPMSYGVPALDIAALPFVFAGTADARAAMDGELGAAAIETIESRSNFRILGFFENGFRHISNNVRPVSGPADVRGLNMRVLSVQEPVFRALGADARFVQITATIALLADGTFDGQENPFENVVAYGAHPHQRYYTATFHSYMSRPIFVHRPTFDAWPLAFQEEMRAAVRAGILEQRAAHDQAEIDAQRIIREAGGEIIALTAEQRAEFIAAVQPLYADARERYDPRLLQSVGL